MNRRTPPRYAYPPEREREIQGLLIGIVAFNLIPHAFSAPPWIVAIAAAFLAWKALHLRRGIALPSRLLANGLAGFAAIGVFVEFGTIFGQEPASALLLLLASLKVLDTDGYRDAMLVILTSYFLLMTHVMASQSLPSTAFMAADVFLITTLMFHAHKRDRRGSLRSFRPIMRLLAYALPLWAFLFFAFPRFGAGLLSTSAKASAGVGFSDDLEPGRIERLVDLDEPAFRVEFREDRRVARPGLGDMYWRGAALDESRGLSWVRGAQTSLRRPPHDAPDGPIAYEAILEPGYRRHLFVLERARTVEFDDRARQLDLRRDRDGSFSLAQDADGRLLYRASAAMDAGPEPETEENLAKIWLQKPKDVSPRTIELAERLARGAEGEMAKADRVVEWLARDGFRYTRAPGAVASLDQFLFESKRGFCEHYAGAFATLMRLMNVPARVVVGFLGGKRNEFGSYVLVRGLDAHAWAEIYRRDLKHWERVDPTQSVAPMRALLGGDFNTADPSWIESGLSREEIRRRLGWFARQAQTASMAWDAAATAWSGFLLRYDFDYQLRLLARIGVEGASRLVFWIWLAVGAIGLAAAIYGFLRWQARREDPLAKSWRRLCARLERAGLARAPNEGPLAFAARLRAHGGVREDAPWSERAADLADEFALLRYGLENSDRERARRFRRAVARFRLEAPSARQ